MTLSTKLKNIPVVTIQEKDQNHIVPKAHVYDLRKMAKNRIKEIEGKCNQSNDTGDLEHDSAINKISVFEHQGEIRTNTSNLGEENFWKEYSTTDLEVTPIRSCDSCLNCQKCKKGTSSQSEETAFQEKLIEEGSFFDENDASSIQIISKFMLSINACFSNLLTSGYAL